MLASMKRIKKFFYTSFVIAFVLALLTPLLGSQPVLAAQMASRSITMSDSGVSAGTITTGVGSGTNVSYEVGFTTTQAAESVVIDFCSNSPIIADTCTAPTGFSVSGVTVSSTVTGGIGSSGWTIGGTNSAAATMGSASQFAAYDATAAAAGAQTFTIAGVTNPSTLGAFYARIYTFANTTYGTYSSATSPGDYLDYGGIALSTNNIISITARVQETISFCVSGDAPSSWTTTHDCSDPNANVSPALTLGHGSPTPILDQTQVDSGTVYSQLSTNATSGAVIAMRNSTGCGGLSANGGTSCAIPAIGSTASAIVAGTADFGMAVGPSVDDTNGVGSLTPASTYYSSSNYTFTGGASSTDTTPLQGATTPSDVYYGMNATNVDSTYGDTVASTSSPCYRVDSAYTFAATAALTTPAGIYTANMDLIATGTF